MKAALLVLVLALAAGGCSAKRQPSARVSASPSPTTSPVASATPCTVPGATTTPARRSRTTAHDQALLHDVRYSPTGCPRVVFEFENTAPPYAVQYHAPPFAQCASGEHVDTSTWGANAYVVVHATSASGVDLSHATFRQTYTKSKDIAVGSPTLRRIHETCDFEGTLEWVIGLDATHPFKVSVLSSPPRLVIDVSP